MKHPRKRPSTATRTHVRNGTVRSGTVWGWATTTSGYQHTVIDGDDYLTDFDLTHTPVARGTIVEYEVSAPPTGRSIPFARITRVVGRKAMKSVPRSVIVKVGRKTYTVVRTPIGGLRYSYDALEPTRLDKRELRSNRLLSLSHSSVATLSPDGRVLSWDHDAASGRSRLWVSLDGDAILGRVSNRTQGTRADAAEDALRAIVAAYGNVWRRVESQSGGSIVASD